MTATFPAPSIQAQIAELKREKEMRRVFPRMIGGNALEKHDAEPRQQCLDAAIASLEAIGPALNHLRQIANGYANQDISHHDFRVNAAHAAEAAIATLERLQEEQRAG